MKTKALLQRISVELASNPNENENANQTHQEPTHKDEPTAITNDICMDNTTLLRRISVELASNTSQGGGVLGESLDAASQSPLSAAKGSTLLKKIQTPTVSNVKTKHIKTK